MEFVPALFGKRMRQKMPFVSPRKTDYAGGIVGLHQKLYFFVYSTNSSTVVKASPVTVSAQP